MIAKNPNESGIHVRYNDFRNTMKFVTIVNKKIISIFCCYHFMTRDQMSHFRQVANKNQNSSDFFLELLGKSVTKSMPTISQG